MRPGSILGTEVRRLEDPELLTGAGTFIANLVQAGDAHAVFVRSPLAHARVSGIEVSEARNAPGVLAVFTREDQVGSRTLPGYWEVNPAMRRPALAGEVVRYVGEPVALVIAESRAQAVDAAELVDVDYDPLPVIVDIEEAVRAAEEFYPGLQGLVGRAVRSGAEEPLSGASRVVRVRTLNQRIATAPMEGHALLADPTAAPLTVWVGTQQPHDSRETLATDTGLGPDEIRVIAPHVGGGFGGKAGIVPEALVVVRAARELGRRVLWQETRSEAMLSMHGRGQLQWAELGLDDDARITGLRLTLVGDCGAYGGFGGGFGTGPTRMMAQGPYLIPQIEVRAAAVSTNTAPMGAFRGAGRPEAAAILERLMDLAALEFGLPPEEVRRRNLIPADRFPFRTQTGPTYDTGEYHAALEAALSHADLDELRTEQQRRRDSGATRLLGIGLSSYVEVTFGGGEYAAAEVHTDGTATVRAGTSAHGQGHATSFAMLAADQLGLPVASVRYEQSDTALVPRGGGTGGSRSLQSGGSAVRQAVAILIERARSLAAELLEADAADVVLEDGQWQVAGVPGATLTWAQVATAAADRGEPLAVEHDFTGGGQTFPFGSHVAVVEVDTETGRVRPLRLVAVDDCGVLVNPLLVAGQQHGGAAQGMSQALWEEFVYDQEGNPLTGSFADYAMPGAADTILFETHNTVTPTEVNPLGVKGIGESATIGSTPAFWNAVIDALSHLGVTHLEMPCTPARVWEAIQRPPGTPWSEPPHLEPTS